MGLEENEDPSKKVVGAVIFNSYVRPGKEQWSELSAL